MEARFKTLQIIWAALLGGTAGYTAVVAVVVQLRVVDAPALPPGVMAIAATVAVLHMGVGTVARRRMIEAIPTDAPHDARFAKYQMATIVGLAILEAGGLLVITLGILADSTTWVLAGGGASLWTMALARPQRSEAGIAEPGRG